MKTEYFSIRRAYEIPCKVFAPETGEIRRVILGVHGFAGDKESSMLEKLGAMACRHAAALVCFDFPAHGDSPVGEEWLTVENCRADLLAVLAHLSRQYPQAEKSVFATSFGGYISLCCARELGGIPMVLRAPAVTMPRVLLDHVLKISAEAFRNQGTVGCGFERPIRLPYSFYEDLSRQESLEGRPINAPMLIIHGDLDDVVPLSHVEAFAATQSRASLHILKGADHRFKKPGEMETVVDLVKGFLGI